MKRFHKFILASAAFLSVAVAGSIWLLNDAVNMVSDGVDSALGGAQKVRVAARQEIIGVAHSTRVGATGALSSAEHAVDSPGTPAPAENTHGNTPAKNISQRVASVGTGSAPHVQAEKSESDGANIEQLLSLCLSDGSDASDPADALLSPGNKSSGKSVDDTLISILPGANSPTVKRWMEGKYEGNEAQALEDAADDPAALRLLFFLAG